MILADFRSGKALAYFDRLVTSSDDFGNHDSAGIMAIDPRAIEQVIPSESDAARPCPAAAVHCRCYSAPASAASLAFVSETAQAEQ